MKELRLRLPASCLRTEREAENRGVLDTKVPYSQAATSQPALANYARYLEVGIEVQQGTE